MSHGTYGEEVALVTLIHGGAVLEELAADHARGGDDDVFLTQGGSNGLYGFLSGES